MVATIATAVEEQSAATKKSGERRRFWMDTNENVNQSTSVSTEISGDIAGIRATMDEMSTGGEQVNLIAQELSKLSEGL